MKNLKQILFMMAMVVGLALGVSAQKGDDPKRPPKTPPVIRPGDKPKPPRGNPPKDDREPKKPGMAFYLVSAGKEEQPVAD